MYPCPNCNQTLNSRPDPKGVSLVCSSCGGRAVSVAVLRRMVDEQIVKKAWRSVLDASEASGRRCPTCGKKMVGIHAEGRDQEMALDVCRHCEFFWFDPGEFEAMPPAAPKPHVLGEVNLKALPQEMKEKIALATVKDMAEKARIEDATPDEGWKSIPAFFGMPVELDSTDLKRFSWATWILGGVIAAVSVPALFDATSAADRYGLIPSEAWRLSGLTFFTSFFLHLGVIHLMGNLYFLVTFGRAVENFLGHWRWLLLVFAAAIGGDVLHVMFDPRGMTPCVGASGGISGLLIFYALKFPHARLGILFRYIYVSYRWIQLPAWAAFGFWILLQAWGAYEQVHGLSNVSALAHLGGVLVGFLLWLKWRNLDVKAASTAGLFKVIG